MTEAQHRAAVETGMRNGSMREVATALQAASKANVQFPTEFISQVREWMELRQRMPPTVPSVQQPGGMMTPTVFGQATPLAGGHVPLGGATPLLPGDLTPMGHPQPVGGAPFAGGISPMQHQGYAPSPWAGALMTPVIPGSMTPQGYLPQGATPQYVQQPYMPPKPELAELPRGAAASSFGPGPCYTPAATGAPAPAPTPAQATAVPPLPPRAPPSATRPRKAGPRSNYTPTEPGEEMPTIFDDLPPSVGVPPTMSVSSSKRGASDAGTASSAKRRQTRPPPYSPLSPGHERLPMSPFAPDTATVVQPTVKEVVDFLTGRPNEAALFRHISGNFPGSSREYIRRLVEGKPDMFSIVGDKVTLRQDPDRKAALDRFSGQLVKSHLNRKRIQPDDKVIEHIYNAANFAMQAPPQGVVRILEHIHKNTHKKVSRVVKGRYAANFPLVTACIIDRIVMLERKQDKGRTFEQALGKCIYTAVFQRWALGIVPGSQFLANLLLVWERLGYFKPEQLEQCRKKVLLLLWEVGRDGVPDPPDKERRVGWYRIVQREPGTRGCEAIGAQPKEEEVESEVPSVPRSIRVIDIDEPVSAQAPPGTLPQPEAVSVPSSEAKSVPQPQPEAATGTVESEGSAVPQPPSEVASADSKASAAAAAQGATTPAVGTVDLRTPHFVGAATPAAPTLELATPHISAAALEGSVTPAIHFQPEVHSVEAPVAEATATAGTAVSALPHPVPAPESEATTAQGGATPLPPLPPPAEPP